MRIAGGQAVGRSFARRVKFLSARGWLWLRAEAAAETAGPFVWSPVFFGAGAALYFTARPPPLTLLALTIEGVLTVGLAMLAAAAPRP